MRLLKVCLLAFIVISLFGCVRQGPEPKFAPKPTKSETMNKEAEVKGRDSEPKNLSGQVGHLQDSNQNFQPQPNSNITQSVEQNVPAQTVQDNNRKQGQSESIPPPKGPSPEEILADQQRELQNAATANKIALIKDAAKAYNEMLARFESFPSQYQQTADDEVELVLGSISAGAGQVKTPRTDAMQKKLLETSNSLNELYNKVMDTAEGKELYSKGPLASARNARMRRIHTNVFEQAAKIVESFPYLLAR
jgi:hypothetical protein